MSSKLFSEATWLRADQNRGYAALPIPAPRDTQIADLLRRWLTMDSEHRLRTAAGVDPQQGATLRIFAERMASLAVRNRDPDLVKLGLLAAALDESGADAQGGLVVLSLLFRASQTIELNASSRFIRAARLLSPKAGRPLLVFCRRTPHERSIESMGYVEGRGSDGFRFTPRVAATVPNIGLKAATPPNAPAKPAARYAPRPSALRD